MIPKVIVTRKTLLEPILHSLPAYRRAQIWQGLFQKTLQNWESFSVLPKVLRDELTTSVPWMMLTAKHILESAAHDTFKALLLTSDGKMIETVLMKNARGHWSICVSSQVGCAMACTFCATGKMGFTRNLTVDEIIDQYRFWMYFLCDHKELDQQITNVVYMGMGEPLANYDNVKASLLLLLQHTEMGPTRLTVSTVGLIPMLKKLLLDSEWPPVRLAVSLHSADSVTRQNIMPSSYPKFLDDLAQWTKEYFVRFTSRRRHLTFEYVMLAGVNDTVGHAEKLIRFARKVGKVKINLIPYNDTHSKYQTSESKPLLAFESKLHAAGIDVTRRRTMGADIAAACGQLIVETAKK
ncbi:MAG: 23S rRNA (adenine(2503)-C(2))-methyltransferase RlmN [Candidatus Moraniibacteriota bacterium]|nr:MAG: 23S rRNA (adenine(2503)-C(2))-methyltransferase RlmN [Candidatus Moranbacteria bacterium]